MIIFSSVGSYYTVVNIGFGDRALLRRPVTFLKFSIFSLFLIEYHLFRFELIFGFNFRPGHHPGQTLLAINLYTLLTIVQSGVKILEHISTWSTQ